ncbi:unnamed protein product [Brassica rapa]|uniref:Homeobox domain-containing protein n=1 Tax=Brassica campestris TaxID=3711 RepID=A0A3P5YEJ6_BRACM|nr:unnamed protein product [Brassica rapa]VDC66152.1 unnamed protein product [Brassica rapa]
MAVYYSSNANCYQQEPIYLDHQQQQQQASSSSAVAAASFVGENVRNEMVFIPPTTGLQTLNGEVTGNGAVSGNDLSFYDGQGLSLSLGNQISLPSFHHHHFGFTPHPSISVKETPPFDVEEKSKEMMLLLGQSNPSSGYAGLYSNYRFNETSGGFMSSFLRSRYLKPAQNLLDEVVSVKKELNQMRKKKKKGEEDFNNGSKDTQGELSTDSNVKLSTIERQELQNKKNKLLTMVDEVVDKRYNQYYHQMEALASSFEIVAGFGSAKPYTSLALNKISCSFRSLRDAIKEQIQIIREKLGEKGGESLDEQQGGGERIPRLRYLDQRLRQQRAFHQQLGMVRPSWRPQRGLPENSVSVLRAWLFEHFLHPYVYPKESEKMMLAKQTGLSKNQVANWFINARVRLWKPMIEDIYKEEFGNECELQISKSSQELNSTNQEDSSSQQQQGDNNNNLAYPSADTTNIDDKPQQQQQEMNRSGDYETLMNYQGFGLEEEYRYMGGNNQEDSRFSSAHHLHDFVV